MRDWISARDTAMGRLPFTIQANYAGRYWRGAAPPMFNRPRRHVRRGRSHFCDGKQSRARETRAIPQMSTRAKMTSLQICRIAVAPLRLRAGAGASPEITCDFRQIWQRGGKATNPLGLSVRPVGRTADGSNRRFEARHRMAGEAGPPPITIRP